MEAMPMRAIHEVVGALRPGPHIDKSGHGRGWTACSGQYFPAGQDITTEALGQKEPPGQRPHGSTELGGQ